MPSIRNTALVVFLATVIGCAQPPHDTPVAPSPLGQDRLTIHGTNGDASYRTNFSGSPGYIEYRGCASVHTSEVPSTTLMTIRRIEHWMVGPDGTIYAYYDDPLVVRKIGGDSGSTGYSACTTQYNDLNLTRPTATTYRVRIEYTYDSGSPAGAQILEADLPITSSVPARPIMTGLTIESDAPGQVVRSGQVTLNAAGTGGRAPYEYQWSRGSEVLRDWSSNPRFEWTPPLTGSLFTITVAGRGAGGTSAELANVLRLTVQR